MTGIIHYLEPESVTYDLESGVHFGIAPCGVTDRRVVIRDDGKGRHGRGRVHGTTDPGLVTCKACQRSLARRGVLPSSAREPEP